MSSLPLTVPSSSVSEESRLAEGRFSSSSVAGRGALLNQSQATTFCAGSLTIDRTSSSASRMSSVDRLVSSRMRRSASATSSLCRDRERDCLLNLDILLRLVSQSSASWMAKVTSCPCLVSRHHRRMVHLHSNIECMGSHQCNQLLLSGSSRMRVDFSLSSAP